MLALISRSTIGKIVAMWLPITTFFAQGYEHSIVNMFVIPAGKFLGAPIPISTWWLWNQIPVTLGNILGGALLTGMAIYITHCIRATPILVNEKARAIREATTTGMVTHDQATSTQIDFVAVGLSKNSGTSN